MTLHILERWPRDGCSSWRIRNNRSSDAAAKSTLVKRSTEEEQKPSGSVASPKLTKLRKTGLAAKEKMYLDLFKRESLITTELGERRGKTDR